MSIVNIRSDASWRLVPIRMGNDLDSMRGRMVHDKLVWSFAGPSQRHSCDTLAGFMTYPIGVQAELDVASIACEEGCGTRKACRDHLVYGTAAMTYGVYAYLDGWHRDEWISHFT